MYNSHIRIKMEHASLGLNCVEPIWEEDIDNIEGIQKNFTGKITGRDDLDYHQRLNKLDMYIIINAWEQLEV